MHKLLCLVVMIMIVSYAPLEVLADGKLQQVCEVVKHMNTIRLRNHDCKPELSIRDRKLTASFRTNINCADDADDLYKCMHDYMKAAVGDARSECKVWKTQLAIVFHGEYDPNKKPSPPLTTLAGVLVHFQKPDLGGYVCTKEISKKDGRIFIKVTHSGKNYVTDCDSILKYLNQS